MISELPSSDSTECLGCLDSKCAHTCGKSAGGHGEGIPPQEFVITKARALSVARELTNCDVVGKEKDGICKIIVKTTMYRYVIEATTWFKALQGVHAEFKKESA